MWIETRCIMGSTTFVNSDLLTGIVQMRAAECSSFRHIVVTGCKSTLTHNEPPSYIVNAGMKIGNWKSTIGDARWTLI